MAQETREPGYSAYISQDKLYNAILFQKLEQLDQQLGYLLDKNQESDQTELHSVEWKIEEFKKFVPRGNTTSGRIENSETKLQQDQRACVEICDRASAILGEWEKTSDIRIQIQYATIIIKKIENLKKTEYIAGNEARKKICTLLRNTIKLNSDKALFTPEQLGLIQNGLEKAVSADVTKEDMLQMNRLLHNARLRTMPAWE